jgi:excisionase family DNA binding protein
MTREGGQMTEQERDPWLTYAQAAQIVGVHKRTIGNAAKRGDLQVRRTTQRLIRLRRSWLDAWIDGAAARKVAE